MIYELDFIKFLEQYKYYEEKKIKSRRKFEKDLFCILLIIFLVLCAIFASCLKIENYLESINTALLELQYN
jgi:hypothetical protein